MCFYIYALFGVSLLTLFLLNGRVKCVFYVGSLGGLDAIYGQAIWFTSVSLCLFDTKPFTRSGFCSWKVDWRSMSHTRNVRLTCLNHVFQRERTVLCVCFSPVFLLRRNENGWNHHRYFMRHWLMFWANSSLILVYKYDVYYSVMCVRK